VEELGGEGREEGEGVGAPFNVLPPGATDLVAPLESGRGYQNCSVLYCDHNSAQPSKQFLQMTLSLTAIYSPIPLIIVTTARRIVNE